MRNQLQETTVSVQYGPEMWFLAFDFGAVASAKRTRSACTRRTSRSTRREDGVLPGTGVPLSNLVRQELAAEHNPCQGRTSEKRMRGRDLGTVEFRRVFFGMQVNPVSSSSSDLRFMRVSCDHSVGFGEHEQREQEAGCSCGAD